MLEDGELAEYHVERGPKIAGNVYKARVVNVLRGMDAAFVDIGLDRNAFLALGDVMGDFEEEIEAARKEKAKTIASVLKVGQELLVQVSRTAMGGKGARVTTRLTLPGRYVVLVLGIGSYVGVSRKIEDENERRRLRDVAEKIRPRGRSLIIRTEAQGKGDRQLGKEVAFLGQLADRISDKAKGSHAPSLIHEELPLVFGFVRDVFGKQAKRVVVEPKETYEEIRELMGLTAPAMRRRVVLHDNKVPLFAAFGLEAEIEKLLRRRVWLPNGSHITIEQTEALTAIDVNSGRYTAAGGLAETVLNTNLQAAPEIARQLRLRNVGGIIVVDFIDMDKSTHRTRVTRAFEEALAKDRARTKILHISPFGLVEMTRKRTGASLRDTLMETCPHCGGLGKVLSPLTVSLKIERELAREAASAPPDLFLVRAHPNVALQLVGPAGDRVAATEKAVGKPVYIRSDPTRAIDSFDILNATPALLAQQVSLASVGQTVPAVVLQRPSNGIALAVAGGYHIGVKAAHVEPGTNINIRLTKVGRSFGEGVVIEPAPQERAEKAVPRRRRGRSRHSSVARRH